MHQSLLQTREKDATLQKLVWSLDYLVDMGENLTFIPPQARRKQNEVLGEKIRLERAIAKHATETQVIQPTILGGHP